jgi:glutamine amidotransferase
VSNKRIAIIDYGMGNLGSVSNAMRNLGVNVTVSNDLTELSNADAYILPGVGAFPQAALNFEKRGIFSFLNEQIIHQNKPILGICLGMHLMANESLEQGRTQGLGWIDGQVIPIEPSNEYHVPHVGWNNLLTTKEDDLFKRVDSDAHFFFDHSYKFIVNDEKSVLGYCEYGQQNIISVLRKGHIFATQFHPEKSQRNGLKVLRNYLNYVDQYYQQDQHEVV